ncbi:hypothetical protein LUZ61_013130 [Rhynchospora tenuis]|uniref:Heat shock protein 70 n=1 Tax=Rhynchospora tenuis TaxID=198213 RepID=A0AAD5W860_9POAL|nr:hypothetical protein LUZ61_013130 [Rhynchospora tenuis]
MTRCQEVGPMIAIDLGTSCARASVCRGGRVEIIATVPSYVAFTSNGDVLIGEAAKNQAAANPVNTIFNASRLIGRAYSDSWVQSDTKLWPFKVVKEQDNKPMIAIHPNSSDERHIAPEEIFSMILIHVKEAAESFLGYPIENAVVTVPVYFNHVQRQIVKDAGSIAGVSLRLISSSVAATMAYGFEKSHGSFGHGHNSLIFDLGAGTLDVSVVTIEEGVYKVKAVAGDTHLGGEDFDSRMLDYFVSEFWKKHKKYISNDSRAMSRLRTACERAKRALSSAATTTIGIVSLHNGIDFHTTITRAKFEELNMDILQRCLECVKRCLKDAMMERCNIDDIILVGGSTNIPRLQQILVEYFDGKELSEISDADAAVTYGAAILASILGGDMHMDVESLILLDIAPFSLGLEIGGGVMSVLIPRNTRLPTKKEKVFSTDHDNQTSFLVRVFEGDGTQTQYNNFLGEFELCGIPPLPKGVPQINICFQIDANGALIVSAEDRTHGLKKKIRIGSTDSESRIINSNDGSSEGEDEDHRWEDAKKLLTKSIENIKSAIDEESTVLKISSWDKRTIEEEIESVVKWMGNSSCTKVEDFMVKMEELENLYNEIMGKIYLELGTTIGIDFGTTYSCVGVWVDDHVEIISDEQGSRTMPSCVAFTDNERLVGDTARQQSLMNPTNTIFSIKHLIGRNYSELSTGSDLKSSSLMIVPDADDRPVVQAQYKGKEKKIVPEEIASMIFRKMKEISEAHVRSTVKNTVLSVPSYFGSSQRKALINAALIAGLNTLQIINEPTAAAIAYYSHKVNTESSIGKTILVFDLGGGYLDVSVISICNGVLKVLASVGNPDLSGDCFDRNIVDHFVQQFKKKEDRYISSNARALRKLRTACEKAKRVLSTVSRTTIEIDSLYDGIDFCSAISRDEFEEINKDLLQKCIEAVENCLEEAQIDKHQIDDIIPVGGSTRIPKIQQLLQEFFDGKELYKSINPDEAVAYGSTIQAAILTGGKEQREKLHGLKVHDVNPLSVGLETASGDMSVLIPRNNPIPANKEHIFTTSSNNQTSISIQLRACESGCFLGKYNLIDLPLYSRGIIKMHVTFSINIDGILSLKAYYTTHGKKTEIDCKEISCGLDRGEIEQLMQDLENYKMDDEENLMRIEAKNALEDYAYRAREVARNARDAGKLYFTEKRKIERAVEQAINWLDNEQFAEACEFEEKLKELKQVCDPLIQKS